MHQIKSCVLDWHQRLGTVMLALDFFQNILDNVLRRSFLLKLKLIILLLLIRLTKFQLLF